MTPLSFVTIFFKTSSKSSLIRLKFREFSLDIRTGRCSGIPWCCMSFYVLIWKSLYDFQKFHDAYFNLINKYNSESLYYIPCPKCIKHPVQVKRCTEVCGHNLEWEELGKYVYEVLKKERENR